MYTTTGLIDLQVNGFAGCDFNDTEITAEKLDIALEAMLKSGVTACLPTIISASHEELVQRFMALDTAVEQSKLGKIMIPGYHLEGPFLNPTEGYAGCHPAQAMSTPDASLIFEIDSLLVKPILIVSYAPELDTDNKFAKEISTSGKLLSVGHSSADYITLQGAIANGLKMSTHLGNGVPQHLHKLNNTILSQLSCDELSAGFIADGLHIPPFALKSLLRAKTLARSILVTDAVSAAACQKEGIYPFADMKVERAYDGSVRVPGATNLAGSSLELDQAIRNVVQWNFASFSEAIMMASENPFKLLSNTLNRYKIQLPKTILSWSKDLRVVKAEICNAIIREYH